MTRLNECCLLFNWQGGTIHQVNDHFNKILDTNINVLALSDFDYGVLIQLYVLNQTKGTKKQ